MRTVLARSRIVQSSRISGPDSFRGTGEVKWDSSAVQLFALSFFSLYKYKEDHSLAVCASSLVLAKEARLLYRYPDVG